MTASPLRLAGLCFSVGLLLVACSAGGGASSTPNGDALTVGTASSADVGVFLTGPDGRTLYVLTTDGQDRTTCTGTCAAQWPPLTVSSGAGPAAGAGVTGQLGTFARPDGTVQVTYLGMPLYYYAGDTKAGDTAGQGIGGVWFVASVAGGAQPSSFDRYTY